MKILCKQKNWSQFELKENLLHSAGCICSKVGSFWLCAKFVVHFDVLCMCCVVCNASVFALSCPDLIPVLELLSLRYEGNKSFQMIIQFPQFAGRSLRCNRAELLEGKIGLFLPGQETCTDNQKL